MNCKHCFSALGLCALLAAPLHAAPYDFAPLDSVISSWMERGYYPGGGAVIVAVDDSVVFFKEYGATTASTPVYVASAGKWVAAATIAAVVDRTDLQWDDTVEKWLPQFRGTDKAAISLRQLLSHTSGIMPYLPLPRVDNFNHLDSAVTEILPLPVRFPAGRRFEYGGLAMQVAGRMAEVAAGQEFEPLFQQLIAAPLGMTASHFTPVNTDGGHAPMLGGGLCTSLLDYARFLEMIAHEGSFRGTTVLSPGSVREMQADQVGPATVGEGEFVERGLGLSHHGIYGLGEWREKVDETSGEAYQISSPGWAGAYPWLNKRERVWGFFIAHVVGGSDKPDGFSSFYSSPVLSATVSRIVGGNGEQ